MADTEFSTSHALRKERWSVYFFNYARFHQFFSKFIGKRKSAEGVAIETSDNAIVQIKTDFQKEQGDKITFPMRAPLSSAGVTGDDDLEGNEEALSFLDWAIELMQIRHAVRSKGKLSDKRPAFSVKQQARPALADWLTYVLDNYTSCALSGVASADGNVAANVPSTNRKWVGGQTLTANVANGVANNLDAELTLSATSEYFGTAVIEAVKRKARLNEPIIRPILLDGQEWYVMFISPLQAKALKSCTAWKEGHQYADVRGRKNAIFSGALGVWDGVILHEYQRIESRVGVGGTAATEYFDAADYLDSGVTAHRALLCGAQAAVQAYGKLPTYTAKDFDFGNKWGVAIGCQVAVSKPEFDSEDLGVLVVDTQILAD